MLLVRGVRTCTCIFPVLLSTKRQAYLHMLFLDRGVNDDSKTGMFVELFLEIDLNLDIFFRIPFSLEICF